jgi:Pyruvate/2-oxoacid:ferredoxin oxidoreductase delta subunit
MVLFKEVKKPIIKAAAAGADVSPLRPRYVPKTPPCSSHCLNGSDVREWLVAIAQHEAYGRTPEQAFETAWHMMTANNPFPAICGRVCQHACEQGCNRKAKEGPVAINQIERFIGDFGIAHDLKLAKSDKKRKTRVAIVGAGPAGLSAAYHLAADGYDLTIFDATALPGGMMRYRVPRAVIPASVLDAEIGNILQLGVEFRPGVVVGRDVALDDLRRDYNALFFAVGLQKVYLHTDGGILQVGELPSEPPVIAVTEPSDVDRKAMNTISPAIGFGRDAAHALTCALEGEQAFVPASKPPEIKADKLKLDYYAAAPRNDAPDGLTAEQVVAEAKRCMSCGMCMDCETCWMYCSNNCFVKLPKGEHYKIKVELCNGCKKCAEACPCGYIELN